MIRVAKFGDIPRLVEIIKEAHAATKYKDLCEIDEKETKALLLNAIRNHGGQHEGSTFVAVAENKGKVEGYIIGILQRFYDVTDKLEATDWQWLCTKDVQPSDPIKLVKAMHKWAGKNPKCIAIFQANTDLWKNPEAITRSLEGLGMKRCGHVLRKELNHE